MFGTEEQIQFAVTGVLFRYRYYILDYICILFNWLGLSHLMTVDAPLS